jgi:hypothetical protein
VNASGSCVKGNVISIDGLDLPMILPEASNLTEIKALLEYFNG